MRIELVDLALLLVSQGDVVTSPNGTGGSSFLTWIFGGAAASISAAASYLISVVRSKDGTIEKKDSEIARLNEERRKEAKELNEEHLATMAKVVELLTEQKPTFTAITTALNVLIDEVKDMKRRLENVEKAPRP